jgi:hypothetical protein
MPATYRTSPPLPVTPAIREEVWEQVFRGGVLAATLARAAAGFVSPGAFGPEPTVALLISVGLVLLMARDLAEFSRRRAGQA